LSINQIGYGHHRPTARAPTRVVRAVPDQYDCAARSSQQLLFPLQLYFSTGELQLIAELQPSLANTGFVFEEMHPDNVISGLPVNVTESEASIVLEQLLSDLQDGIPESSFSQNDTIAKSMAKSLAVKTGTYLTEKSRKPRQRAVCL
jgi:DNA mismatch repair protein MutL